MNSVDELRRVWGNFELEYVRVKANCPDKEPPEVDWDLPLVPRGELKEDLEDIELWVFTLRERSEDLSSLREDLQRINSRNNSCAAGDTVPADGTLLELSQDLDALEETVKPIVQHVSSFNTVQGNGSINSVLDKLRRQFEENRQIAITQAEEYCDSLPSECECEITIYPSVNEQIGGTLDSIRSHIDTLESNIEAVCADCPEGC